jgi:tRNA-2-methylthio-N6-dimethylallyladenosine synthase
MTASAWPMRWPRRLCPTETIEDADLVLLNTCHIREKAAEKVYSELGRIRKLKAERGRAGPRDDHRRRRLRRAGRRRGDHAPRPVVDLVIGPQTYHRLPDAVRKARAAKRWSRPTTRSRTSSSTCPRAERPPRWRARGVTAFLTVQEGCDKFCTFCVVPYTRGSEVSRPVAQIVAEAERLAAAGVREVTLLGQNVNAWHGEGRSGRPNGAWPAALPPGGDPRPGAAALHHQPSARHGRRADRGASRPSRR